MQRHARSLNAADRALTVTLLVQFLASKYNIDHFPTPHDSDVDVATPPWV